MNKSVFIGLSITVESLFALSIIWLAVVSDIFG